jgi:hypothetical protein
MDTTHRHAPSRAQAKDIPDFADTVAVPRLWNPAAAAAWSLLFSPAFGAAVHMRNWQVVGEHGKAREARIWLIASIVVLLAALLGAVFLPESHAFDQVSRAGGIGLLVAWYVASGQSQHRYVKDRYGTGYMRKGWGKPLGIAAAVLVGYLAVAFATGLVVGHLEA